jgi:hypothetical protein
LYWYVWTILLPRWRGYRLEEEVGVLNDGTTITKLVKVRQDAARDDYTEEEDSMDTMENEEHERILR